MRKKCFVTNPNDTIEKNSFKWARNHYKNERFQECNILKI